MKAIIHSVQLQKDEQTYHIKGKATGKSVPTGRSMIFFEKRVSKLDYSVPQRIYPKTEWNGMSFTLSVNINKWQQHLKGEQPWDLYISDKYQFKKVKVGEHSELDGSNLTLSYLYYKIKPYATDKGVFALSVKPKKFSFYVLEANVEKGNMTVSIEVPKDFYTKVAKPHQHTHKTTLAFKKKIQPDIDGYYEDERIYQATVDGNHIAAKVPLSSLVEKELTTVKMVWDVFLTVTDKVANVSKEYRIQTGEETILGDQKATISRHLNAFIGEQTSGHLAVVLHTEKPIWLDQVKIKGENAILEGESGDVVIDELTLKKRSAFQNAILTAKVMECHFTQKEGRFRTVLPLDQLLEHYRVADGDQFFVNASMHMDDVFMNVPISMTEATDAPEKPHRVNNHFQLLFQKSSSDEFNLVSKKKTAEFTDSSLKLFVNGSCFSRMGFESRDYFHNQDYKNRYEVVDTQWHPSIISIMSKPVKYPAWMFKGIHPTLVERIQSDLQKNFFKKLQKAKPDFLLIDFYADGCRDIILFDDKHAVTANYVLRKSKSYIHGVDENVTVLNQKDIDLLLHYWKPAIRAFCKKVMKYIPEERIILQKVRKAETFYTKRGQVKQFKNQDYIQRSNYLFEYMENEFLTLLPDVQTIDLTKQDFRGDERHPHNTSPDHYESGYYRTYMDQMNETVLTFLLQYPAYLKKRKKPMKR